MPVEGWSMVKNHWKLSKNTLIKIYFKIMEKNDTDTIPLVDKCKNM